jgi:DNA primase catalytic core
MARIAEDEIERLKKEISVQRLAEARGIKLTRQGANLLGKCPFHDDKTPSLVITPAKNLWHCMGACSMGGTAIDWVMKAEGISFRHAVELLRKDHLFIVDGSRDVAASPLQVKKCTVPKLPAPLTVEAGDRELLLEVVDFYQAALTESPEAMRYLETRGLRSAEMVERFRLGFANRTLGYGLEAKNRAAGAAVRGRLQRLGIYRESGHEHFNGSLVVPVVNPAGDVVEMYGRKITPNLREGTPNHLYLPGEHRGVWNEEALIASKEIILCEALIDALTFWAAGFRNVTASYGTNGFTADHKAAFERHGTRRVYIAYDRDEAGDKAAAKLAEELLEMGLECFRVEFPKGMDANAYALKVTPAAKSLGVLLNRASWLGKGQKPAQGVAVPVVVAAPEIVAVPEKGQAAKEKKIEPAASEPDVEPVTAATAEQRMVEEESILAEIEAEIEAAAVAPVEASPEPAAAVSPTEIPNPVLPLAAVLPPVAPLPFEVRGDDVFLRFGDREYRVRGLEKNTSPLLLKINLRVLGVNRHGDMALHVDTLEMSSARQRGAFAKQAAEELHLKEGIIGHDLSQIWMKLELLRDEQIAKALAPKEKTVTMTEPEREAALELLRDPRLVERIVEDFARCGVVGEETNKLVGYLGAVSRHLEKPLAVIVQSSSASGKSSLMDAVLAFVPEEHRVQYSSMTGQSLFYMGDTDLQNKVLAIAEEAGAQRASYPLKLLQSEGEVSIASTGKDPVSGKHITHEYRVKGPVMLFLTTTSPDVDEELLNRCLVLSVNEDREQTQAIHRVQRESQTLDGLLRKRKRDTVLKLHRNAQRLLRPLHVVNDLAVGLSFPDSMTRTRRDHMKFLTLIRAIAFLHQWQREVKTTLDEDGQPFEYIEATKADVELAKRLIHDVLGRSLDDMQGQTRRLLLLVDQMVTAECKRQKIERAEYRFSRRDVRATTSWSDSQLKTHLRRLEDLEYLIVHRGGRGQSFVYELFFEQPAEESQPTLPGLEHRYDAEKSGLEGQKSGAGLGQVWGVSGAGLGDPSPISTRLPVPFYENGLKITVRDVAGENQVVAVPPHRTNGSLNGNGHHAGGAAWPV